MPCVEAPEDEPYQGSKHVLRQGSRHKRAQYVGFEVLTAVVMKNTFFWDITPRSPLKFKWSCRGKYCLHLQCRINKSIHLLSHWYLARLILRPWRWKRFSSETSLDLNGLYGVIPQKMVLFRVQYVVYRAPPCIVTHSSSWHVSFLWLLFFFLFFFTACLCLSTIVTNIFCNSQYG
jgi:hypothetical protein